VTDPSTDLTTVDPGVMIRREPLSPDLWLMIQQVAPAMYACRYYGLNSPEQAMAIMLTGWSYGFDLAASFRTIHIIDGRPSISSAGAWALVLASGELESYDIAEETKDGKPYACVASLKRRGLPPFAIRFSLDDAKRAGLTEGSMKADGKPRGSGNWEKYPSNMLRWRALGYAADVLFADLLAGLKRADELSADADPGGIAPSGQMLVDTETGEVLA